MSSGWKRLRALAAPWAQAKAKAIAMMWSVAVALLCMGWIGSAQATDVLDPYWHYISEPFADAESPQGSCDLMAARFGGPLVFHAVPVGFGQGKWVVGECWTADPVSPAAFSAVFHVATCPPDYALVDYPAAPDAASCQLGGEVVDIPVALSPPPPECDVCKGNPIYPLRGVKHEEVDTGLVIGRTTLTFSYDTTSKTPKTPKVYASVPGLEQIGSVLGSSLWYSNLHRRGTVRTYSGGTVLPVVAVFPRGYAQVISMPRAADGTFAAEPGDADRLMSIAGGGHRYNDSKHNAQEIFDAAGVLTSIAWTDGTLASFTYSDGTTPASIAPAPGLLIGAMDNRGHSLSFRYVAAGALTRLASITDAAGQSTTLGYDSQNRLMGITWSDGTTRSFLYENSGLPWALTGVSDERAKRYSTFTYDIEGRAIATEHAGGVDRYSVSYTTPPAIQVDQVAYPGGVARYFSWVQPQGVVMTEPSGQTTTWSTVSVNGKNQFSSQSQPAGAGSLASSRSQSYDANGRVASKDDFNGKRSCYVHDATRGLEAVQVTRLGSELNCTSVTGPGANLPAGAVKVSTQWHPDWNLPIRVAAPGQLTTSVYNGRPDPFNAEAIASCAPAGATLPDGKPLAALCKRVEQSTADSNGSTGFALRAGVPSGPSVDSTVSLLLHADGAQASTVMTDSSPSAKSVTAAGGAQLSTTTSRFGPSSIRFNGGDSHVAAQGADAYNFGSGDFTVEFWVYLDSASINYRGLVVHDQIGGVRGWLIYTETSGVPQAGALSAAIWSGSTAYSVQDTVPLPLNTWHHVALVRSGQTLALYRNGQPVGTPVNVGSAATGDVQEPAVIGALQGMGAVLSNSTFSGYVDEVRITKGLARYAAAFTVPTAPFVAVSDAVPPPEAPTTGTPPLLQTQVPSRVSEWTYDADGRVLTATDPDTGTTTFAYHAETNDDHQRGDLKSITTSLGKMTTFDRYNRYGQVLQSTDPSGVVTVNTYDLRQRLLTNTVGGETTTYAYDEAGQLKKVTFDNGTWVGFDYDDAHRQVAAYDHKANRIDYVLDNAGNKTDERVKDPAGALKRGLVRAMDALGRAQQSTGRE